MTTPTDLVALVRLTRPDGVVEERPGHLVVRALLDDAELRGRWIKLRAEASDFIKEVTIIDADIDAPLEDAETPAPGTVFRIVVQTVQVAGQLRLFFASSLMAHPSELYDVDQVLVADMAPDQTFSTYRSRYQMWTSDPPEAFAPSELLPDPRGFVTDFTGERRAPSDVRPWLLRAAPQAEGGVFAVWADISVPYLLATIADRVSKDDQQRLAYHFNGPPAAAVTPSVTEARQLLYRLQEGVRWVFADIPREASLRHLLLAAEWARTYQRAGLQGFGEGSLASAEAAWDAHVKSGSRETLKALAELRKTIVDEAQKASQRAQELAGSMWKDLAIAATPFVLKLVPDINKAESRIVAGVLALLAAIFLVFSFSMQVYINKRYFYNQKSSRIIWKRSLNVALSPGEIEEFSEKPIRAAICDYRRVRFAVGLVYAGLAAVLIWFSAANLAPPPAAAEPPPKAESSPAPAAVVPMKPPPAISQPPVVSQLPAKKPEPKAEAIKAAKH